MDKKNNGLLWAIVGVLLILAIVYFSQANAPAPTETGPIKVGVLTPLTGDAAVYGSTFQKVYDLAVEQIDQAGGVNGRQIELVYEDGKCNGEDATTATQKLLNVDGVKFVLGGACSGETLAAATLTQAARAILISPSATSPDITDAGDLVYRTYPSDAFEGALMADYAVKTLTVSKAAVVSENTDFAQGVRKVFVNNFIGLGKNIVFDEKFNTEDTDFRTMVTKLKASNPEIVYVIPQTPATGELLLKQMHEAGMNVRILGANSLLDRDAFKANPSLYEGMILAEVALDETNVKTKSFLDAYQAKYQSDPNYPSFSAAAYDSVYLLAEALENTDSTDPEKVAEYWNTQVKDWPGAVGTFNFDTNGDALINLSLVKVVKGVATPIPSK